MAVRYLDDLRVLDAEEGTERGQHALLHDVRHLLLLAADRQVADGPRRLLLRLELALQCIIQSSHWS